jgi:hypothetical protein
MSKTVVITLEKNSFNVRGAILNFMWIEPNCLDGSLKSISLCINEDEEVIKKELQKLPENPESVLVVDSAEQYLTEIFKYLPSTFTGKVESISHFDSNLNGIPVLKTLFVNITICKDNSDEARVTFSWNEISGDSISFCNISFFTSSEDSEIQKDVDRIPQIIEKIFVLELQDFDLQRVTKYLPNTFSQKIELVPADVFEENKQNIQDEACCMIINKIF